VEPAEPTERIIGDLVDALAEANELRGLLRSLARAAGRGDEMDGAVHAASAVALGALLDVDAECAAAEAAVETSLERREAERP